jgi:NADPH2:quinone reductase
VVVNFAETHQPDGSCLTADLLPWKPGSEVVGHTPDGRRVLARVSGGYAEQVLASETALVDIPEDLPAAHSLALLTQGLTACHLLRTATRLAPGESMVVHCAAGGGGSLAVQLARRLNSPGLSGRPVTYTNGPDPLQPCRPGPSQPPRRGRHRLCKVTLPS